MREYKYYIVFDDTPLSITALNYHDREIKSFFGKYLLFEKSIILYSGSTSDDEYLKGFILQGCKEIKLLV